VGGESGPGVERNQKRERTIPNQIASLKKGKGIGKKVGPGWGGGIQRYINAQSKDWGKGTATAKPLKGVWVPEGKK